jgi:hypothetical protein
MILLPCYDWTENKTSRSSFATYKELLEQKKQKGTPIYELAFRNQGLRSYSQSFAYDGYEWAYDVSASRIRESQ